jgi:GNAT superfamily N-acetyltransferase
VAEEQKQAFLQQQHQAQHFHYRQHYEGAEWLIIESGGRPVGRLYRAEWPREIRIMDVSLLPEARGGGIGTHILQDIQQEPRREESRLDPRREEQPRLAALRPARLQSR